MKGTLWDKKLKICTEGRDDYHEDEYHYPYEPTPYPVLQRLVGSGYVEKYNHVIDYGCGKGRVSFFLHAKIGCTVTGVEYDARIFQQCMQNRSAYVSGYGKADNLRFFCADAESYDVADADCFYFFNPFSLEILRSVLGRIMDSYYANPRLMHLFFYYPNDEYVSYLMTMEELQFWDEIECQDLFAGENDRERILIFEINW